MDDESNTQRAENVLEVTEITIGEDTIDVNVLNVEAGAYAYKKVANRTKPVATTLPEEFRIKRKIPVDPLLDLPELPTKAPPFTPGERYTQDRKDNMKINEDGFLNQDEEDLVHWIIREYEHVFAWDESEKSKFSDEYFDPVVIPTIEHIPWVLKNIPIPRGSYDKVISAIRDKIKSKIYEPSNSSYRSRWFTVIKKDGKSLRLVHDLQPLNAVTIKDSAVPPTIEPYAESFGGRSIYTVFDLFVGFDQRALAEQSRDLTTFQTPLGTFRLTSIPMGYTNSMQIFHGDTTFILQDEIPHVTIPFIDDIPIKGPETRFEKEDGTYETIPDNPNIRKFVYLHLCDDLRIVHRLGKATAVISAPKVQMGVEKALIVGHLCSYLGREPDVKRVQKILDWPPCQNETEVRGFLGVLSQIRMFIKDFAKYAKPLTQLTKKDVPFLFGDEEIAAMQALKHLTETCPAIRPIDYHSSNEVIFAVDSSYMAVGYVLSQMGDDGKRYPNRFGSITFNDRESRYSQAKLELYGLYRAVKDVKMFIIGVLNLVIEVDAKYIKGMINNPDVIPSAAANRWIAYLLLFTFSLRHIPGKDHAAPDGLSRRPRAPEDPDQEDDDDESWMDYGMFTLEVLNWRAAPIFESLMTSAPVSLEIDPKGLNQDIFPHVPYGSDAEAKSPSKLVLSMIGSETKMPRDDRARRADKELDEIKAFLESPTTNDESKTEIQWRRFIRKVSDYFVRDEQLWKKDRQGRHKIVIPEDKRLNLIMQAHDELGHKGFFTVRLRLLDRFWWPRLEQDVKWYIRTCHECQIRNLTKVSIPATVPTPRGLFRKIYMDTMLMPKANGYRYIIHGRCSLTAYPEWDMLKKENATTIGNFIFTQVLCRWGAIEEIVTDNAPQYIEAATYLAKKYHIHHIRISAYNSRAQGPIERRHFDVREALIKAAEGDETKWPQVAPYVFWAERISIQKSTGFSPYRLAHGVDALLPFDLSEATYLAPPMKNDVSTEDLVATRARMLQKRPEDLERVKKAVTTARWKAVAQLEKNRRTLEFKFEENDLVLVRNSVVDKDLGSKTMPRYLGPMVVVRKSKGNSYILSELDGSISKLRFAAFRLFPYRVRDPKNVQVTKVVSLTDEEMKTFEQDMNIFGEDDDTIEEQN